MIESLVAQVAAQVVAPVVALADRSQFGVFDLVEALIVILVVAAACARAEKTPAPIPSGTGLLGRLSATPVRMAATLLVAGLVLRGALLPLLPPPVPIIPDDFSLLLQAQTFLQGRLANPAHPLGAFFDTKYVNQLPAYASIYFPGRSLPLVIGIVVSGHPWAGVWLTMLALALATAWMLRAWVAPPRGFAAY